MAAQGVVDALTNTYTDVAKMKLLPDANQHAAFLDGLQNGILKYIQMQANGTTGAPPGGVAGGIGGAGGGLGAAPAAPGMGAPGMGPGGAAPTPQMPNALGGMGGGMPTPGGPGPMQIAPGGGAGMSGLMGNASPDDLRRLLASAGGGNG